MVSLAELVGLPQALAERALGRIRGWWSGHGGPHVWVAYSGGKDSGLVLALAVEAGIRFSAVFSHIPGQTHADNLQAARAAARALGLGWETVRVESPRELASLDPEPGVVYHVVRAARPYWELLRVKGPPAPPPRPRWCCYYYKEEVRDWLPAPDGRRYILVGAKRSDSRARAKRWESCEREFRPRQGPARIDYALAPVCDFNDHEVWLLLRTRYPGVYKAIRPQYEKWGRSPNCVLCPLASRRQLETAVKRLPTPFLERYLHALKHWDTSLAKRMRGILEAELARRGVS